MSAQKIKKVKPEYSSLGIEIIKFDVIVDVSCTPFVGQEVGIN